MDERIAIVTGATGGIGQGIVAALRERGSTVVTADRPGSGAEVEFDVRDRDATRSALADVRARYGRLDVVVANAGVGTAGPVEQLTDADWDDMIAVNLGGVVNTVLAAYPAMIDRHAGSIVAIASLAGLMPAPLLTPYAASKHAVVGLTTSLAIEARRHGVHVGAVCPGPVDTPLLDGHHRGGVDLRRYLTRAAGPAVAPAAIGAAVVRCIDRRKVVVAPRVAAVLWRVARLSPALTAWSIGQAMDAELVEAQPAGSAEPAHVDVQHQADRHEAGQRG